MHIYKFSFQSAKLEDRYQQLLKELENAQNAQNEVEQARKICFYFPKH